MSSSLRERAASMAGRSEAPDQQEQAAGSHFPTANEAAELPPVDIAEPGPDGPEQVPVHVAWSRVMGEIRRVTKGDRVEAGNAGRYAYRGVDRALNAFGPACRLHGVLVLPVRVEPTYRDTQTSQKKASHECCVLVTYRIVGPAGDHLDVQSAGESMDSGDKATAKAQAVALRTLLYHAGLVPSGDPDPDSTIVERGEAPVRSANSYRDELIDPNTSYGRTQQIGKELRTLGMLGALVTNETGDEETLNDLGKRMLAERSGGAK